MKWFPVAIAALLTIGCGPAPTPGAARATVDPLPSWNDGASKRAIVSFVTTVATEGSPDFVPVPERIATFDNDGTLWAEQPMYFQLLFAIDRVRAMAPAHPEWKSTEPYKSVLAGDMKGVSASGDKGIMQLVAATHSGMSIDAFADIVRSPRQRCRCVGGVSARSRAGSGLRHHERELFWPSAGPARRHGHAEVFESEAPEADFGKRGTSPAITVRTRFQ